MQTTIERKTYAKKKCYKCKLVQPASNFDKDASHPSGLAGYCIPCRKMRRKKAWHNATPEQKAARREHYRAYREAHKEEFKAYFRQWQIDNRDKVNQYSQDRRARLANAFVEHVEYQVVYERDNGICGICGEFVEPEDFSLDHVVALVNGGLHCYSNVQTSHLICNMRKGAS